MERIAVGLDGSVAARSALRWAMGLSAGTGGGISGINAFQNPWSEMTPQEHDRLVVEREELLRSIWLGPASEAGIAVDGVVRDGGSRGVILDAALADSADVLVVGRTGSGGGTGFLHLGSIVQHAAHHATIPFAVIPAGTSGAIERIVVGVDGSAESRFALGWVGEVAQAMDAEVLAVQVMDPCIE